MTEDSAAQPQSSNMTPETQKLDFSTQLLPRETVVLANRFLTQKLPDNYQTQRLPETKYKGQPFSDLVLLDANLDRNLRHLSQQKSALNPTQANDLQEMQENQKLAREEIQTRMMQADNDGFLTPVRGELQRLQADEFGPLQAAYDQGRLTIQNVDSFLGRLDTVNAQSAGIVQPTDPLLVGVPEFALRAGIQNLRTEAIRLKNKIFAQTQRLSQSQPAAQPQGTDPNVLAYMQKIDQYMAQQAQQPANPNVQPNPGLDPVLMGQAFRGEILQPLPPTESEQAKILFPLLERIEEHDTFIGPVPGQPSSAFVEPSLLKKLTDYLGQDNCSESLRRKVMARLRLQHSATVIRSAKSSRDKSAALKIGFELPEAGRYALDANVDFKVLFVEERNIPVAQAFKLLDQAHQGGITVNGRLINLGEDENAVNKAAVESEIESQLGGGKEARKALQLAWRIADATLESNVWNHTLVPGDLISEATHFRETRQGKFTKDRDVGPPATVDSIPSLSTSYFRWAKLRTGQSGLPVVDSRGVQKVDKQGAPISKNVSDYLTFNYPNANINIVGLDDRTSADDRRRAIDLRNKGYISAGNPSNPSLRIYNRLDVENLPYQNISEDNAAYKQWITYTVPQQLKAQELLLQTDVGPDVFGFDKFEGYKSTFGQIDGGSAIDIRLQFVYGILNYVLNDANSALTLKWDENTFDAALKNLVRPDNPANPNSSFITQEQLNQILELLERDGIGSYASIRAKLNFTNSMRRIGWF